MKQNPCFVAVLCFTFCYPVLAQQTPNSGLDNRLSDIYRLSDAKSRSISPENPTEEKGKGGTATEGTGASAARDLGKGWKISPSVDIAGEPRTRLPILAARVQFSTSG